MCKIQYPGLAADKFLQTEQGWTSLVFTQNLYIIKALQEAETIILWMECIFVEEQWNIAPKLDRGSNKK